MGGKNKIKNKKKNVFKILNLLYYIIIGLLLGVTIIGGSINLNNFILILIQLIVIYLLVINIHELGHLFYGKLYGYELSSYRIGFFSWSKENGKMKFSFIKNRGYSGLCSMIPPEKELPNYKELLYYAGGIFFNFIFGVIFIMIDLILIEYQELPLFFSVLGICSLLIGALNLLPFMLSNNPTDGKLIWSILLKNPFSEKLITRKRLISKLVNGTRPSLLELPNLNIDNLESFDLFFILYAYFQALDKKDNHKMLYYITILEDNIDKFSTPSLPGLYFELCFVGCITNDINRAKTYYQLGGSILRRDKDINGCRVKAYYEYYINKNCDSALELCYQGLAVIDKFPIKGQALMEGDLIKSLMQLIDIPRIIKENNFNQSIKNG